MNKIIFAFFLLTISTIVYAQRGVSTIDLIDGLNYSTNELPEDILSSKSLVLVQMPLKSTMPDVRANWHPIAEKTQLGLKKAGIDAVAYFYIDDVFSGPEVVDAFAKQFQERELKNVIFLLQENNNYKIIITAITDKDNLLTKGQNAYKIEGTELSKLTHEIYLKGARSGQERTNLLIIEVPIFGDMAQVINGKRGEYYDVNFTSETVAIPAFADTVAMRQALIHYPYKYEIVDPTLTEKELRNKGNQYVMYFVYTTGKKVKQILEYPTNDTETVYISEGGTKEEPTVKSINVNTPVYKFYIKHIYSEKVFLGTKWDAATTWAEALDNYSSNMRNQMVR